MTEAAAAQPPSLNGKPCRKIVREELMFDFSETHAHWLRINDMA
jgi:hypothetical protein